MADTKISALSAFSALAFDDLLVGVDISDTTMAASGTDKKITVASFHELKRLLLCNASTSRIINGAGAADTYLTGSFIAMPAGYPVAKSVYRAVFDVSKTAAGTATPIVTLRFGTAGSTADTAVATFTFGAGTLAIDSAIVDVQAKFRTVGSGTSAVLEAWARASTNLTTTGWSNAVKVVRVISSGFNSTTANAGLGLSYNGGTGAVHTVEGVYAELMP